MNYRWPTKIRKFGIDDPLLKIIVAKYENEIPWQTQVKNQNDLFEFVSTVMLPKVYVRIAWPPVRGVKHFFVSARNLNMVRMLDTGQELDSEDIEIVRLLRDENGDVEASEALAYIINKSKLSAFEEWTDLLVNKYTENPAFSVLVLRPILETSGAGSWRTVIPASEDVIAWLFQRLKGGSISPAQNLSKVYANKLSTGSHRMSGNGWQLISKHSDPAQLVAACRSSGWCISDRSWAADYLQYYDFYLLRIDNRAMVALRVQTRNGQASVVECQGTFNTSPGKLLIDVHFFTHSMGIEPMFYNRDMEQVLSELGDVREQPLSWWKERDLYWPFARQYLPPKLRVELPPIGIEELTPYLHYPLLGALLAQTETTLTNADWVILVEIDPCIYMNLPITDRSRVEVLKACLRGWVGQLGVRDVNVQALHEFLADAGTRLTTAELVSLVKLSPALFVHMPVERGSCPDVFEACFSSWTNKLSNDDANFQALYCFLANAESMLTTEHWVKLVQECLVLYKKAPPDMRSHPEVLYPCVHSWINQIAHTNFDLYWFAKIPYEVRRNKEFQDSVKRKYPAGPPRLVKPSPEAWGKYMPSSQSVKGLDASGDESFVDAVEVAVGRLLAGWLKDSSDAVLGEGIRSRGDFPIIRQEVWSQGIEQCPALWLILPDDLVSALDFKPHANEHTRANLQAWIANVRWRPWLLGRVGAVPKSVRFHECIFDACVQGWADRFKKSPWRLYVPVGVGRFCRFTIPVAICYLPSFIEGVVEELRQRRNHVPDAWSRADKEMRRHTWYQVAMLRAIEPCGEFGGIRRVELKIAADIAKQQESRGYAPDEKYVVEIRSRLYTLGFEKFKSAA